MRTPYSFSIYDAMIDVVTKEIRSSFMPKAWFPIAVNRNASDQKLLENSCIKIRSGGEVVKELWELASVTGEEVESLTTIFGVPLIPRYETGDTITYLGQQYLIKAIVPYYHNKGWGIGYTIEDANKEEHFVLESQLN
jgi:hypothetical protein